MKPVRFQINIEDRPLGYSFLSERAARHFVYLTADRVTGVEAVYVDGSRVPLDVAEFAAEAAA